MITPVLVKNFSYKTCYYGYPCIPLLWGSATYRRILFIRMLK